MALTLLATAVGITQTKQVKTRRALVRTQICGEATHPLKHYNHYLWSWTQNSYNCSYHAVAKNSVKNSLIQILIRICTEIERFVASKTSHPSLKFTIIRRQLLELPAKFEQLPISRNEKICFKNNSCIPHCLDPDHHQNSVDCCQTSLPARPCHLNTSTVLLTVRHTKANTTSLG